MISHQSIVNNKFNKRVVALWRVLVTLDSATDSACKAMDMIELHAVWNWLFRLFEWHITLNIVHQWNLRSHASKKVKIKDWHDCTADYTIFWHILTHTSCDQQEHLPTSSAGTVVSSCSSFNQTSSNFLANFHHQLMVSIGIFGRV